MRLRAATLAVLIAVSALSAGLAVAPAGAVIDGEVTFGFSTYDGSLSGGDPFTQTIEADDSTDQLSFTDWRIDEFDDPDFGVNMNDTGPDSIISDPAGDSFQFVSFTTEVFCGNSWEFDVVGYEDGSQVSGAQQHFDLDGTGGATTRTVSFASVDEVRFENYDLDDGNQCLKIDDIVVDEAVTSNTQPSFSNLDATVVYDEVAGTPVVVDGDATVSDAELDVVNDYAGSTLTIEREGGANGDDTFDFDTSAGTFTVSGTNLENNGGNVFASFTQSGGTLTIDFNSNETAATSALADDVLQGITYENTGDPAVVEYGLTVTFEDGDPGGSLQASQSLSTEFDPDLAPIATSTTIDFTDLGPELSNLDPVDPRVIDEVLFYGFQFGDAAESGAIDSNELQLDQATSDQADTGTRFESDDVFRLDSIDVDNFDTDAQDVTVHGYRDGSQVGSVTFSMGANSDYETKDVDALDDAFLRVDEVRLTTSDSDSVAIDNLVVEEADQPPTVDLDTGAAGTDFATTFRENDHQGTTASDGVAVTGPVAVSDPDGTVESVTLTLDNLQGDDGEGLAIDTGNLSEDLGFDTPANQIEIERNAASNAELVEAIEAVRYQNDDDTPDTVDRTVTVNVTDDSGATASATATVEVEPGNDAPSITPPDGPLQPDEDDPFDLSGASGILIGDADAGMATIEVSLSADHGTLTLGSTTGLAFDSGSNGAGAFTASGTVTDLNNALATLDYQGDADYFGPDNITATVNDRGNTGADPGQTGDGSSEEDTATISLDVQPVPDDPTISAITNQTTDEDQTISGIEFDVDDAETAAENLDLSFSSDNQSLIESHSFGGSGTNRTLDITPAQDVFGSATVTVTVSDDSERSASEDFLLEVEFVDDPPVFTSVGQTSVNESDGDGVTVVDVNATDGDGGAPDATVDYSITDGNVGGAFAIAPSSGVITIDDATSVDFESQGSFALEVEADDGTETNTTTVQVTVTNAPPSTPTDSKGAADEVAEGAAAGTTTGVTVNAADPGGGTVTFDLVDDAGGRFQIDSTTGEVTVADGSLIDYETTTSHTVSVRAADDDGLTSGTETFTINVTDVNEPPTAVDDHYTVEEDDVLSIDAPGVLGNDTDEEGDPLSAIVLAGPTNGSLALAANGSVTYAPDSDFVGQDSFTYEASDGNGGTASATVTISVTRPSSGGGGSADDAPATPSIEVADVALSATEVDPGDTVTVTVDVENDGDGDGMRPIPLAIDGETVDSKAVFVGPGGTHTITLAHAIDQPGTYAVTVDGEAAGTVTVAADQTTPEPTATTPATEAPAGEEPGTRTETPAPTDESDGAQTPDDGGGLGVLVPVGLALVVALASAALLWRRER